MVEKMFSLPLSEEFLNWLEVSITEQDILECVESKDDEKWQEYKQEINAAIRAKPRWVFAYRQKFGDAGFFTERLPKIEELMRLQKELEQSE